MMKVFVQCPIMVTYPANTSFLDISALVIFGHMKLQILNLLIVKLSLFQIFS